MANRRQLKKQIRYICGDVAAECAMAKYLIDGVNRETLSFLSQSPEAAC